MRKRKSCVCIGPGEALRKGDLLRLKLEAALADPKSSPALREFANLQLGRTDSKDGKAKQRRIKPWRDSC